MTTVRQLTERDIDEVTELFLLVTPEAAWRSAQACAGYLRRLLFGNPWRDLDIPSWVAERSGRIVAFYLLLPRRLRFRGEPVRAAAGCQFSVHPDFRRSSTALQLARAAFRGPQDLTFADGAYEKSRDMWLALGGQAPLEHNLHWVRPLRPARHLLTALRERDALPGLAVHAARPAAALVDRAAARLRWNDFLHAADDTRETDLDVASVPDDFDAVVDADLQPDYDPHSLAWLLDELRHKREFGELRARAVRGADGSLAGWYVYALRRGAVSEVAQIAARRGSFAVVLRRLLADAWRGGAAALRGRGVPGQTETLSAHHCWFRREGKCTLLQTRRADIADAIAAGRVFLSRLEGEWWLRLVHS